MQFQFVAISLIFSIRFASAFVPTAQHLAAIATVISNSHHVGGNKEVEYFFGDLPSFLPDPTTHLKEIFARNNLATSKPVDPEIGALPEDIIRRWGYPYEKYDATTEDGYILALYRIPYGSQKNTTPVEPRPVVFLQHGLECSCTNWIANLPNQSAGFMFADAGFDVWMGNFRGNTYSKRHVTLSSKQHEFWEFSWDEMARFDLPAMINKAMNISGAEKIYYVGHSMGTLTAFGLFSQDQQFAQKVKKFYALGPVTTVKYIRGVFRWFAPFLRTLNVLFDMVGLNQFLPNNWVMDKLATYFCGNPISDVVCTNILFLFGGPDSHQMNVTRLPVYLSHTPAGTSTQNIVHFGQMVHSGKCQMYDYQNKKQNKLHYNQDAPPEYDLTKMQTPVAIYWGGLDWLATPTDVENLIPKLQNLFDNQYLPEFNHLDFIWGLRAANEAYTPILNDIREDFKN